MVKRFTILIGLLSVLVWSCKKKNKAAEEETPVVAPAPTQPTPPALLINLPTDAEGVFIASFLPHKYDNATSGFVGNAQAFIYPSATDHSYIDGGTVMVNDTVLPRLSSGSYYFFGQAIQGQPVSGIDFSINSKWKVSGNTATGVPSFSFAFPGMPFAASLIGTPNASRTNPYDAVLANAPGADSLILILSADSLAVKKTVEGATNTVHYTAGEMAGVRKKVSFVQGTLTVISYKVSQVATLSTKKYYCVNAITSSSIVYIGP